MANQVCLGEQPYVMVVTSHRDALSFVHFWTDFAYILYLHS